MFEFEALKPNGDGTYRGEGPRTVAAQDEFLANVRLLRRQGFDVSVKWTREPRDDEADAELLDELEKIGVVVRN